MAELSGLDELASVIEPVARRFTTAGHRVFLVGGVVRDLALGLARPATADIDLTTDAEPTTIRRLLGPVADALWSQGERFGTIGATVAGRNVEITTHRAEVYDPESRKPIVTFGRDLVEDLSRRDFTINAVAVELPGGRLHDPFDGLGHLAARELRTPLSPEVSFGDDPLRMLRAARFTARFELTPTEELVTAAEAMAGRLSIVSVERVADELERLLVVDDPRSGLELLLDTGLLAVAVPAFADAPGAGPVAAALASRPMSSGGVVTADGAADGSTDAMSDPVVRRAGLLWPVRRVAADELTRLRYAKRVRSRTTRLLAAAESLLDPGATAGAVRRFAAAAGTAELGPLRALIDGIVAVDDTVPTTAGHRAVELIDGVPAADLADLDAPLSAAEIMDILGVAPGPAVGRAQRHLLDHRLDHGPLDPIEARRVLSEWWRGERDDDDSLPLSP